MIELPLLALRDVIALPDTTAYIEITRRETILAVEQAMKEDRLLFVIAKRDADQEETTMDNLFEVGSIAGIRQVAHMPNDSLRVVLMGRQRGRLLDIEHQGEGYYVGIVEPGPKDEDVWKDNDLLNNHGERTLQLEHVAMIRKLKQIFQEYAEMEGQIGRSQLEQISNCIHLAKLMDLIVTEMPIHYHIKQKVIDPEDIQTRYELLLQVLEREVGILKIQQEISKRVKEQVDDNQRDYYLREQLKAIHKELGEENIESEADRYERKIKKLDAPKKVKKKLAEELRKFKKLSSGNSESAVVRGYIETLLAMPWRRMNVDNTDMKHAEEVLEADHYGLKKVKERVLECLAVKKLKADGASPIICLVGAPGTGKTSVARSVARALDRKYVRICLGGVRDEAELRGHRRTYVGAMPGRIATALKNAKVKNPLILFDEIDKLVNDGRGDPAAAMLEILDPEQNKHFSDHYVELPLDLSKAFFICTANTTDTIPKPLLDRMEVISLSGYTENEKFHIAREHLWHKQLEACGIKKTQLSITDKAIRRIIINYTREAGVRTLERRLASICRKAARKLAVEPQEAEKGMAEGSGDAKQAELNAGAVEAVSAAEASSKKEDQASVGQGMTEKRKADGGMGQRRLRVSDRNLKEYLGKPNYLPLEANEKPEVGIVRGLAWTSVGGETLEIEVMSLKGSGKLELTGKLGEVMQESAKIALTYVRSLVEDQVAEDYFEKHDIHIHVPEGATPKDGPSAGVTMTTAIYSAVTGYPVYSDVAMTGEVTLRGRVLEIGGLKEKLLAAKASKLKRILVPKQNAKDIEEMEEEILEGLTIKYIEKVEDVLKEAVVTGKP